MSYPHAIVSHCKSAHLAMCVQDEDVVAPEVMAAAGLWEDIELPARRQVFG